MSVFEISLQIKFWSPVIFFSIGAPAALLNAIIFMGIKTFRRSPSAYYVVGQSFADVNVLLFLLLQVIPSTSISLSSISCKLMIFFTQMMTSVAMSFLCLSAFDRWACTSQSARIRQLSSIRVARFFFPIPFIFWTLVNIPFLIYSDLVPPMYTCWFTNDLFTRVGTLILSPILTVLLPLVVLILFGLLTYCNIRLVSHIRQQPNQSRMSTWEQQMTRMMLTQTLLSIICTIPRAVYVAYTISINAEATTMSFEQISIILLADSLTISIVSVNFASSFYIFLFSSPRFRQTILMYLTCRFHLRSNQIAPANMLLTATTHTERQTARNIVHPTIQTERF